MIFQKVGAHYEAAKDTMTRVFLESLSLEDRRRREPLSVLGRVHHIQPFSRVETLQRIQAIQEMLREDSLEGSEMCEPDTVSDRVSPGMPPDAGMPAAHQRQRIIEEPSG